MGRVDNCLRVGDVVDRRDHAVSDPDPFVDHLHHGSEAVGRARRRGEQVVLELAAEPLEPEKGEGGEDLALIGDAVGHDHVVRADAVRGDDEEAVPQVVDVPDFTPAHRVRQVAAEKRFEHGTVADHNGRRRA